MINQAKIAHYSSLVEESSGNQKKTSLTLLKSCFINPKLQCFHLHTPIRCIFKLVCDTNLEHPSFFPPAPISAILSQTQPHKDPHCRLSVFEPICVTEIKELIMKSPSKSCELDPVPTSLMKQNIDVFAKYITIIVNRSLSSGCFPDSQKVAHVKPLLKKPNLDGKTIERVVSSRISDHVRANNLSDTFQSAYKPFHGTETALLRINNDILSAMDDDKITALVLLYLSAAFDTVDHKILLSSLQYHLGIHDIALDWCKSYLLNSKFCRCVNRCNRWESCEREQTVQ